MCKSFSTIRRGFTILATITGLAFATATSSLAMTLEFEFGGVTGTISGLENDIIGRQADSVVVTAASGSDVDFSSPFAD